MADDPTPPAEPTSADAIEAGKKRKRKSDEERLSYLEDENQTLRESNKSLEKQFNDICKTFKVPVGKETDDGFWQSLASELGL